MLTLAEPQTGSNNWWAVFSSRLAYFVVGYILLCSVLWARHMSEFESSKTRSSKNIMSASSSIKHIVTPKGIETSRHSETHNPHSTLYACASTQLGDSQIEWLIIMYPCFSYLERTKGPFDWTWRLQRIIIRCPCLVLRDSSALKVWDCAFWLWTTLYYAIQCTLRLDQFIGIAEIRVRWRWL